MFLICHLAATLRKASNGNLIAMSGRKIWFHIKLFFREKRLHNDSSFCIFDLLISCLKYVEVYEQAIADDMNTFHNCQWTNSTQIPGTLDEKPCFFTLITVV